MILTRRTFLQVAGAAIATPLIAQVAVNHITVAGISEVESVTRDQILGGEFRFANAIFTPGQIRTAAELIQLQAARQLPHGMRCEIRAVPLNAAQMARETRRVYKRDGYAVLWVTDANIQSRQWSDETDFYRIGSFVTGDDLPAHLLEWS